MRKLYFLLFALLIGASNFAQNLAANGGFESWTAGVPDSWTTIDFSTDDLTENTNASFVTEGSSSAMVNLTTQDQGVTDIRQSVALTSGVTYTVSLDVYASNNQSRARIFQADGYTPSVYSDPTITNDWQTISFEYTPDTTGDIEFGIRFYDISADWVDGTLYYIDNFQVVAGTTPSIAITSPTNGEVITSADIDIELAVQNFEVGATSAGLDGHIHYTVDGGSLVMKYDTDPIALTGLADGEHTVDVWLVDNNHTALDPAVETSVTFTVTTSIPQVANIAALRTSTEGELYELTGEVVVTFVTGNTRNQIFIEDASAAILIDDNAGIITTSYAMGDGITGISGQLTSFGGVMQFVPSEDPGMASSTGNTMTPQSISLSDLVNDIDTYESELVSITGVTFADGDGSAMFESSTNYDITDSSVTEAVIFRTNYPNDMMAGEIIPNSAVNITVLASEYFGDAQVYPRSPDEVLSVNQFNLENNLSIYPNPVSDGMVHINMGNNGAANVSLFTVLGKKVMSQELIGETLNVSHVKAGIYLLQIEQNGNSITKKLVIK